MSWQASSGVIVVLILFIGIMFWTIHHEGR